MLLNPRQFDCMRHCGGRELALNGYKKLAIILQLRYYPNNRTTHVNIYITENDLL